jgi:hypothetical protein
MRGHAVLSLRASWNPSEWEPLVTGVSSGMLSHCFLWQLELLRQFSLTIPMQYTTFEERVNGWIQHTATGFHSLV